MNAAIKRIRSIKTISELLDLITVKKLEQVSKWLLFVLVMSPFYAMFRSLFFEYHTSEAYFGNLLAVGRVWQLLIRQVGYLGIIIGILLIAKAVLHKKRHGISHKAFMKEHLLEFFLIVFLFWTFLSTLFSTNFALSWSGDFYRREGFVTYLAYAGIFSMALTQGRQNGFFLARSYISVAFILTLLSFIDSTYLNQLLTLSASSSIFHNANHFGYYLLMALMVNFMVLITLRKTRFETIIGFLITYSMIAHIIITNRTFGVFLALVIGFLISLSIIFWLKRFLFKKAVALFILFSLVSVLSSIPTGYLSSEGETLSEDVSSVVEGSEDAQSAGTGRWGLWMQGVKFAGERPLFGYGPDNLGVRYNIEGYNTDRPHNEFIQFAASLGIPAAFIYISAVVSLAIFAFKHRVDLHISTLGLGFTVIAYLASSMFGNTMFYTTPFYLLFFSLTYRFIKLDTLPKENPRS